MNETHLATQAWLELMMLLRLVIMILMLRIIKISQERLCGHFGSTNVVANPNFKNCLTKTLRRNAMFSCYSIRTCTVCISLRYKLILANALIILTSWMLLFTPLYYVVVLLT